MTEWNDSWNRYLDEPPAIFLSALIHELRQETTEIQMLIELLSDSSYMGDLTLADGLRKCEDIYQLLRWAQRYIEKLNP